MLVLTDRSRIEAYQKCPRLRYWQYEHEGWGLDLDPNAVALNIGSAVHVGVSATCAKLSTQSFPSWLQLMEEGLDAARACLEYATLAALEDGPLQTDLVDALVRTWHFTSLPALAGWRVQSVEQEESFDYDVVSSGEVDDDVRLLSRSDWIAEATAGARLNTLPVAPGLYVWNLKTCRNVDEWFRLKWQYDAQLLTELLGPEKRLGKRIAGVVMQALVKTDHPLVWAWRHAASGEVVARCNWKCETAHTNLHKKKPDDCPGGKWHRLGGDWERVLVRDAVPGGQAAWFNTILAEDPPLLREFAVTLGPFARRSDYEIARWCAQHLTREARLATVVEGREPMPEAQLDRWFPQHTHNGNCIQYAKVEGGRISKNPCPALSLCWGGESPDSFALRTPNHPDEVAWKDEDE